MQVNTGARRNDCTVSSHIGAKPKAWKPGGRCQGVPGRLHAAVQPCACWFLPVGPGHLAGLPASPVAQLSCQPKQTDFCADEKLQSRSRTSARCSTSSHVGSACNPGDHCLWGAAVAIIAHWLWASTLRAGKMTSHFAALAKCRSTVTLQTSGGIEWTCRTCKNWLGRPNNTVG